MRAIVIAALALSVGMAAGNTMAAAPGEVSGPEISLLVRTTIVALHQANATGNYSVLRDLGDRGFQANYSAATLTEMFRHLRDERINLAPAILYDAQLDMPPRLTTDGLMRLVGHFPTTPQQVMFDLVFRYEVNTWRIDAINVGVRPAPATRPRGGHAAPPEPLAAGAQSDLPPMPAPRPASRRSPPVAAAPPDSASPGFE